MVSGKLPSQALAKGSWRAEGQRGKQLESKELGRDVVGSRDLQSVFPYCLFAV